MRYSVGFSDRPCVPQGHRSDGSDTLVERPSTTRKTRHARRGLGRELVQRALEDRARAQGVSSGCRTLRASRALNRWWLRVAPSPCGWIKTTTPRLALARTVELRVADLLAGDVAADGARADVPLTPSSSVGGEVRVCSAPWRSDEGSGSRRTPRQLPSDLMMLARARSVCNSRLMLRPRSRTAVHRLQQTDTWSHVEVWRSARPSSSGHQRQCLGTAQCACTRPFRALPLTTIPTRAWPRGRSVIKSQPTRRGRAARRPCWRKSLRVVMLPIVRLRVADYRWLVAERNKVEADCRSSSRSDPMKVAIRRLRSLCADAKRKADRAHDKRKSDRRRKTCDRAKLRQS